MGWGEDGVQGLQDQAKLWLRTTRTPAVARGPLLLKGLSDTPWEHMKFLATDDRWLDDPTNGNFLLALMDTKEYYGEEEREYEGVHVGCLQPADFSSTSQQRRTCSGLHAPLGRLCAKGS